MDPTTTPATPATPTLQTQAPADLVTINLTPADTKRLLHVLEFYDAQSVANTAPIRDLMGEVQAALDQVAM